MKRTLVLTLTVMWVLAASVSAQDVTVIAHRGASGYLPELTLESFAMAHAQGVDYIEIDLIMSKDGALVIMHDLTLEATTNVAEVFPDRHRDDGKWHAVDFSLEEIRRLDVHERTRTDGAMMWPDRFPADLGRFRVPTFGEFIDLVHGLNRSTGRDVGLYVELKDPVLHAEHGLQMEQAVLEELARYPDARVIVQSFWIEALETLRFELGSDHTLALLVRSPAQVTEAALDELAGWVDGVNPLKNLVEGNPEIVRWAHERGMFVHVWTFRADVLPGKYSTPEQEIAAFALLYQVDGVITDHPDVAVRVLDGLGMRPEPVAAVQVQDAAALSGEVVGTWSQVGFEMYMRLGSDGAFRWCHSLTGMRSDSPRDSGTYVFEDSVFTVVSDDAARACRPGDAGSWRVRFVDADTFVMTAIEDACAERALGAAGIRMVRIGGE